MAAKLKNKAGYRPHKYLSFMDDHEDDTIEFIKRKTNWGERELKIEFSNKQEIATTETRECDMGCYHPVVVKQKNQWGTIWFDEADIKKLKEFLNKWDTP